MQTNFFSGTSKALRMPNFCGSGHSCAVLTPEIQLKHHNGTKLPGSPQEDVFKSSSKA